MKVEILPTERVNGCKANPNDFRVVIDGEFRGWVSGPAKGQRIGRRTAWMFLPGETIGHPDYPSEVATPGAYWVQGYPNAHAAILAAL